MAHYRTNSNSPLDRVAGDWKHDSLASVSANFVEVVSVGISLFKFGSQDQNVGAWVAYCGGGLGLGTPLAGRLPRGAPKLAHDIIEFCAAPNVQAGAFKLSLARQLRETFPVDSMSIQTPFSLRELHCAGGTVASAGLGLGKGAAVSQMFAGSRSHPLLFADVTLELGLRYGANLSLHGLGYWFVLEAWEW